jgi:hypothetical protein
MKDKKVNAVPFPLIPDNRKSIPFLEGSQASPLVPVTEKSRWGRLWRTDGMVLTGETRSTRRKTCPSVTLPTTNLTRTDLGSNPGLHDECPAPNRISHCTALKTKVNLNYIGFSPYRAVNTLRLSYTNHSVNAVQWNNRCLFWDSHKTHKYSPYRAVNTLRLSYTNQSVNAV